MALWLQKETKGKKKYNNQKIVNNTITLKQVSNIYPSYQIFY